MLHHANFFYTEDGLVVSTDPVWLQGAFDTLTGLFDRAGIWKNYWKKFGMLCRPHHAVVTQYDAAYKRRMMGERLTHQSCQ